MVPIVAALLKSGLGLVANAALAKGKEYIEEKAGVKLTGNELTESEYLKFKQFELENETELRELMVEDNRIAAEVRKAEIAADVSFQAQAQESERSANQSTDEYVRRTRPSISRKSFYAGIGYVIATGIIFPVIGIASGTKFPTLDAYILAAIYAPCLTFMGVRSIESFGQHGKK